MNDRITFKDKNGSEIKAGDILFRNYIARRRERPGNKRAAVDGMSGADVIVPDEGGLLEGEMHWVTYKVRWDGACMIAERNAWSDFDALCNAEKFDYDGKSINVGSGFYYMNSVFDSEAYEITSGDTR